MVEGPRVGYGKGESEPLVLDASNPLGLSLICAEC